MELLAVIGSCTLLGLSLLEEMRQLKRRAASGTSRLDQMTEQQFEEYLEAMMQKLGYHVERPCYTDLLRPNSDGKAEKISPSFTMTTHRLKIAVCTQHDGKPVDRLAIQSAITAQQRSGCGSAMLICSSDISDAMLSLARQEKVILWAKNDVIKAALSARYKSSQDADCACSERRHSGEYSAQPQRLLA